MPVDDHATGAPGGDSTPGERAQDLEGEFNWAEAARQRGLRALRALAGPGEPVRLKPLRTSPHLVWTE